MLSCPGLRDALIARLQALGFVFDDNEDHGQIIAALAKIQFAFAEPVSWTVTVKVTQTVPDSHLNNEDRRTKPSGEYEEEVEACCRTDAIERAKGLFHARVAIAVLEDFEIEYKATRTIRCSRNHRHHLLVPPTDACPTCGEDDLCNLVRDEADDVHCQACGHVYHRPTWR